MSTKTDYILNDYWYARLKFFITLFLPALGVLYFALAQIWGLPAAEQVLGTITAVGTFLGVFLKVSERSYDNSEDKFDGVIAQEDPDSHAVMKMDSSSLARKDEIRLKVKR